MHKEFIPAQNLTVVGRHHEIYLSDPRRVEPARLRTILRQPVSAGCGGARPAGACDAAPVHLATRVLDAEPRCGRTRLVCVDGRSGSGKTTFGGRLAAAFGGAPVLHMDEICPGWDGLAASVPLLYTGVVASLLAGREATCRRWDWVRSAPAETVSLGRPPLLVVEGVGSGARVIAAHAVLLVWMDAPREVRYRRGIARDGDSYRPHWERWAAQEDLHFAAERTRDRADLHLDGRG